jgi:phospholipid/cholesterol/gamma-HCH transport system substrate-binding protein
MQTSTPSFGKVLTMVLFALSCFGLLLFLWVSFGGPVPLKPNGYRFKVAFPEAAQLGLEADVRVAGVSVGKVRAKDLDRHHPNRTLATIEVKPEYAPVARDARAILRQKTLLGETYVELSRGNVDRAGAIPDGGTIADSRVAGTVQLDEIFEALDPKTRRSFQGWQQELATAIRGHGQDFNDALGTLPAFADDGTDLLRVLDGQKQATQRLIRNTGVVFGALTKDERKLHDLIVTAGQTFDTTARHQDRLAETFRVFPTFLDESRRTFQRLQGFAKATDPLVRDLQPPTRDLVPTLRDVKALAPDLEQTFRRLGPLISASKTGLPALRDTLDGTSPLLAQVQPFLEQLNPVLQWLEYNQSMVSDFFTNGAGALADTIPTRTPNEMGHYLRQWGPTGLETAAIWPQRLPTNRGNAYLGPAAGAGPDHAKYMILPSYDCKNAKGNPYLTKLPHGGDQQTDDDPSCVEQAPPPFPKGNTDKYPHIGAADYSHP